jgi:hypothetical protein
LSVFSLGQCRDASRRRPERKVKAKFLYVPAVRRREEKKRKEKEKKKKKKREETAITTTCLSSTSIWSHHIQLL